MLFDPEVRQVIISDSKKVVTVCLKFNTNEGEFTYVGTAICHPDDEFNEQIGSLLAYGRALSHAAKALERGAWANINLNL